MGQTDAHFGKQGWREYMIVVETGAVGRCDSGRFKTSVCRPTKERAEEWRLVRGRILVAETAAQVVLLSHRVVRLNVVADGIFAEREIRRKIVGRCACSVRSRREICFGISGEGVQILQGG